MNKNINIKELLKGLLIICSYFLVSNILAIPFLFLYKNNIINEATFYILVYLLITITYILIYIKDLIKDFNDFKKYYKTILKTTINYWIKGLFIMIVSSYIIELINLPINTNQEANANLLASLPLVEALIAVLFAPIYEELVFRRGLFKFTDNKHLYAITTGVIFALIHITSSITSPQDLIMLIYLIPYSSVGIAFGYAYKKTNNIFGTITVHSIHNAITLIEMIILGGLL